MTNKYVAFKATLALFLLHSLSWPLTARENSAETIERIRAAVVALVTYNDKDEVIGYGNGFFISSDGRLLSSRHLLRDASSAEVRTWNGEVYPIRMVLSEEVNLDLIELLIDLKTGEVPYLKMSDVRANSGEQVTVFGHQHTVRGFVSFVRSHSESSGNFIVTACVAARATGGPVVNENGDVIAIAAEQTVADQTLVLAIASNRVLAMKSGSPLTIDEWKTTSDAAQTDDGFFFAGANTNLQDD